MYTIFSRYYNYIQVLSFPNETHLPWTSSKNPRAQYPTDYIEPWCLTHWPGANCFITHYCASNNQKAKLLSIFEDNGVDLSTLFPNAKDAIIGAVDISRA
jgi:hypothetical protein